jgi:ribosomal-protein-alanine N-acetyltransferase
MQIRKMTEADLSDVCSIEQETFSQPWSKEDFNKAIYDSNNTYLVAVMDEKVVGYCGFWGIAGEGDIYNVAVQKEYRGRKIAFQMLNRLIIEANSKGIVSLTLEVRYSNKAALHLYNSLGFEQAGIRKDFYSRPKEDAVIMWLNAIH